MNKFEKIKEAVEKRDAFLLEHPELQPLQDEINNIVYKCANSQQRQQKIQELLLNTWFKITEI